MAKKEENTVKIEFSREHLKQVSGMCSSRVYIPLLKLFITDPKYVIVYCKLFIM
jgi:hypothetical protein